MAVPSYYTLYLGCITLLFYIRPFKAQQQLLYAPYGVTLNKQILHFVHTQIFVCFTLLSEGPGYLSLCSH
jgi:hypothetical protein